MRANQNIRNIFLGLLMAMILDGCSNENPDKSLQESVEEITQGVESESNEDSENSSTRIFLPPNPISLMSLLNINDEGLINNGLADLQVISKLNGRPEMSLALGIYSTDLAYCVWNEHPKTAKDYLSGLKILIENSGLRQAVNSDEVVAEFEANLNDRESLTNVLYDIQDQINTYLSETDQEDKLAIYFLGAWVETLYIYLASNNKEGVSNSFVRLLDISSSLSEAMEKHGKENVLYHKCFENLKAFTAILPTIYDEDFEEYVVNKEALDLTLIKANVLEMRALILKQQM